VFVQSVFLGDITAAYEKNPNLESLLFDGFFNKGKRPKLLTIADLCAKMDFQLFIKRSQAGDESSLKPSSGVSPPLRSAQPLHSLTATAVRSFQPISFRRNAITLVRTPSASSQGRRTRGLRLTRTSVSMSPHYVRPAFSHYLRR